MFEIKSGIYGQKWNVDMHETPKKVKNHNSFVFYDLNWGKIFQIILIIEFTFMLTFEKYIVSSVCVDEST